MGLTILLLIFKLPPASLPGSQVFRHTILVAVLVAASFFSLALSLGKLIANDSCYPGALQVLISLNSDLSSGQGFLFLAVFGLDQAAGLFSPIRKLLRHLLSCCGDAGEAFIMVDSTSSSSSSSSSSSTSSSAPSTESSRRSSETSSPNDSICEKIVHWRQPFGSRANLGVRWPGYDGQCLANTIKFRSRTNAQIMYHLLSKTTFLPS